MQAFAEPTSQQFLQRMRETATWCALQNEKATSLRSSMLQPKVMNGSKDMEIGKNSERYLAVELLATTRAQLLSTTLSLVDGRLLAYDPDTNLSDGAANVATQGFFDSNNTPPWDTWLYFIEEKTDEAKTWSPFDSYLLSWIPTHLVNQVNDGIWANPEECICWATDLDTPFVQKLKQWELVS